MKTILPQFETVRWRYNGLGGSVLQWTHKHGSDHKDPSILVWVLDFQEGEIGKANPGEKGSPSAFVKWLQKMKVEHDKKVGKIPKEMLVKWSDEKIKKKVLEEFSDAEEEKTPILIYVAIPKGKTQDKKLRRAVKECRKLESGVFANKKVAQWAQKVKAVRLDFTDKSTKKYLKEKWKVTKAPTVLFRGWGKGEKKPKIWSSASLRPKDLIFYLERSLKNKDKK